MYYVGNNETLSITNIAIRLKGVKNGKLTDTITANSSIRKILINAHFSKDGLNDEATFQTDPSVWVEGRRGAGYQGSRGQGASSYYEILCLRPQDVSTYLCFRERNINLNLRLNNICHC